MFKIYVYVLENDFSKTLISTQCEISLYWLLCLKHKIMFHFYCYHSLPRCSWGQNTKTFEIGN